MASKKSKKSPGPINPPTVDPKGPDAPPAPLPDPGEERAGVPTDPAFDAPPPADEPDAPAPSEDGGNVEEIIAEIRTEDLHPGVAAMAAAAGAPDDGYAAPKMPWETAFVQTMRIPFSEHEKSEKGMEMARLNGEQKKLELEKSETVKTFNAQIDILKTDIDKIAESMRVGMTEKVVQCVKRIDQEAGKVIIFRCDTLEILESRSIHPDESQTQMTLTPVVDLKPRGGVEIVGPWNYPTFKGATISKSATAMEMAEVILGVEGVEAVWVFENDTPETDEDGRPAGAIEVVVKGGEPIEITEVVHQVRPGAVTVGNQKMTTEDGTVLRWSRPRPEHGLEGEEGEESPAGENEVLQEAGTPEGEAPAGDPEALWPLEEEAAATPGSDAPWPEDDDEEDLDIASQEANATADTDSD